VLVRDAASERNAIALVGADRVRLTADMAFVPSSLHRRAADGQHRADLVLVAPCIDDSEGRTIDGPAFPALMEEIAAALPGIPLAFVCHDPRPDMDERAAALLVARHKLTARSATHGYDLSKLLDDYHHAALVVTNRLHAAIFAMLAGRPVLIIDDGNTKTAAAAARFHVPVLSLADRDRFAAMVVAALNYDDVARAEAIRATARAAEANLPSGAGRTRRVPAC
jgi:exopolysaccharide biosynthesis predicted pyruvyltransferase EpsI